MAEPEILSHWSTLLDGLTGQSTHIFYLAMETRIDLRKMPDVKVSRINHATGAIFMGSREYLRVQYKEYVFDICAAPFGDSFFVSWWLVNYHGCLTSCSELLIIGWFFRLFITRETYYRIDTRLMFQSAVHAVVREMVEELCETTGRPVPSEAEFKPVMKEFFKR